MLVKNACWWKTCMLVKNLHQHSPPKFHDVGENNVGEIVCWRKKICSFKIICMLVNYVGENFSVCWWKVFSLVKYVCWWEVYVGEICMLVKTFTNMQLSLTYLRKFYVGENHQNQIFDLLLRLVGEVYDHENSSINMLWSCKVYDLA